MSEAAQLFGDPVSSRPVKSHLHLLQRLGGPGSTAYRLPNGDVLKTGFHRLSAHFISHRDAMLLRALSEETTIPAPELLDEWMDPSDNTYYMRIEYIDGVPLLQMWNDYENDEKMDVIEQLQDIVNELRNWRTCASIGSVDGYRAPDQLLRLSRHSGPHASEQAFLWDIYGFFNLIDPNNALQWIRNEHRTGLLDTLPVQCWLAAQSAGVWRDFIFGHGNFIPENILMKGSKVVGIIDWSEAGSYPVWWDFFKAHTWERRYHPVFRQQGFCDGVFQIRGDFGSLAIWDQPITSRGGSIDESPSSSESESDSMTEFD